MRFESRYRPYLTIADHDRDLVERWNAVVRPNDTVWHLGDVFFGKENHAILAALRGAKKLVLGNHDHYDLAIYQQYFAKIYGIAQYKGCILSHVPIHESQFVRRANGDLRFHLNIHGHMHSASLHHPRYMNVSAEWTGLAPYPMALAVDGVAPAGVTSEH